jgi:membrane-associated HD superfamily phosphohydrolase
MSNKTEKSIVSEIVQGILLLSGITLIILKAAGYIDWSWWIVLIPLYIPITVLAVIFGVLAIAGVFVIISGILSLVAKK